MTGVKAIIIRRETTGTSAVVAAIELYYFQSLAYHRQSLLLQSLKRTAMEVVFSVGLASTHEISHKGGPYGMLLYEIKVLLGYLVCSVTSASNAVEFIEMYFETCENYGSPPRKSHL